ncbi:MAG: CgeB family protein [Thermoplasmataceae archaeon]
MKIMIVGRKKAYNAEYFFERALRRMGHDVELVDSYNGVNHELFRRIMHTRTNIFDSSLDRYWINTHLPTITESYDPDAIILFKGEFVSSGTLEKLSENRKIYLFYPDTYKFRPLLRNRLGYFRTLFTASNNREFYRRMGARNIVTVPWACDPDFHRKLGINKRYKVSFIGTAYPERRSIMKRLGEVDVFGDYWNGYGKRKHGTVYGEEYVSTINESTINLNLQAKISVNADAPTMRTFEIAGCGGFQISDYMPSLKKYFPMMPTFKDVEELKEQIEYYLNSAEEREEISLKNMEICRGSFKYTDSAKLILTAL